MNFWHWLQPHKPAANQKLGRWEENPIERNRLIKSAILTIPGKFSTLRVTSFFKEMKRVFESPAFKFYEVKYRNKR